jgi:hypothetical protein
MPLTTLTLLDEDVWFLKGLNVTRAMAVRVIGAEDEVINILRDSVSSAGVKV